ncbi:MAG: chorismate synthase [Lachnospiraceae bacterium]|nr:chorismate synthase [Lachnospiraceae bacterium]
MAGATFGKNFSITSWVETGGNGIGVVIDGVPAGLELGENDIQAYMNRRRPTAACLFARRHENDFVTVNSGLQNGVTNGTPLSMTIINSAIKYRPGEEERFIYRPGTGDAAYEAKYGIARRVTDRDNAARTAAGAVATAILEKLGISFCSYVRSIGPVSIKYGNCSLDVLKTSPVNMPDAEASERAVEYLKELSAEKNTAGGVVELIISGVPAGVGSAFFDKLDARLAAAVMSIDLVRGVEFGDGFAIAGQQGSSVSDGFAIESGVVKTSNHSGGVLGGVSDGSEIILRAAFAPSPLTGLKMSSIDSDGSPAELELADAAETTTVPRSVVVVESMAAVTILDLLFENMHSKLDGIVDFYR